MAAPPIRELLGGDVEKVRAGEEPARAGRRKRGIGPEVEPSCTNRRSDLFAAAQDMITLLTIVVAQVLTTQLAANKALFQLWVSVGIMGCITDASRRFLNGIHLDTTDARRNSKIRPDTAGNI